MARLLIGYARCSTDDQDLTAQREALGSLGVHAKRIYVDYADLRVMPTSGPESFGGQGDRAGDVGITRAD